MAPAVLAWLDYSESDQRRAREIIAMFSQQESRDELGLGRIRDALSDALFPGTSVLLTRARYLLFVPWLFREGARHRYQGVRLSSWVAATGVTPLRTRCRKGVACYHAVDTTSKRNPFPKLHIWLGPLLQAHSSRSARFLVPERYMPSQNASPMMHS